MEIYGRNHQEIWRATTLLSNGLVCRVNHSRINSLWFIFASQSSPKCLNRVPPKLRALSSNFFVFPPFSSRAVGINIRFDLLTRAVGFCLQYFVQTRDWRRRIKTHSTNGKGRIGDANQGEPWCTRRHETNPAITDGKGLHFFYKRLFYKRHETDIWPNFKNKIRECSGWDSVLKIFEEFTSGIV